MHGRVVLLPVVAALCLALGGPAAATPWRVDGGPPAATRSQRACVAALPVRFVAAQVLMPGLYGPEVASQAPRFAALGIGGALVMTPPDGLETGALLRFKTAGAVPVLLATDEEGGGVQRLRRLGALPSARAMAATRTPLQARQVVADHAVVLRSVGIDVAFAPVVDVQPRDGADPIGRRSFGPDPAMVLAYGEAYAQGWAIAGVLPVLKHFPGHGGASADTHDLAARTAPLDALAGRDLVPYHALAGAVVGVMVGHLQVPGLTEADGRPASMSPAAVRYLRETLGYRDALVFSDSLGMGAVAQRWDLPSAVEETIRAGVDVAVFTTSTTVPAVIDRLVDAVASGRLRRARLDDAVRRVLAAKGVDACHLGV